MASIRELLSAAGRFGSATTISRIGGMIRDMCITAFLPSGSAGAFVAALTVPSTFRQFFAEGTLSAALIPILTKTRQEDGPEAAREAAWSILRGSTLVVGLICLVGIVAAPVYGPWLLPFWPKQSESLVLFVDLLQIMFPFLLMVSIAAWCMGVLNLHDIYFIPAVSPVLFNLAMIATLGGAFYWASAADRAYWAGYGVVVGGAITMGIHYWPVRRIGFLPPLSGPVFHPRFFQFLRAAFPALGGLAIYQCNILVSRLFFASSFEDEGLSILCLFLAFRLVQFPQGILGVAISAAAFPRISASVQDGDIQTTSAIVRRALELLLVLLIPASFGLALIGPDLAGLLYDRMAFSKSNGMDILVPVLSTYCIGLFAFSSNKVAVQLSYAHHDFRTPVWTALAAFLVNVTVCTVSIFMLQHGAWGLAAATTIASWFQLVILFVLQRRRLAGFCPRHLFIVASRVLLASVIMAVVVWFVLHSLAPGTNTLKRLIRLIAGIASGAGTYAFVGALLFRQDLLAALRPRADVPQVQPTDPR